MKKTIIITLLLSMLCSFLEAHVVEALGSKPQNAKIMTGKAVLIARDIYEFPPTWCGRDALIYTLKERGVYWHNIKTGRKAKVSESGSVPLACTHDGEWLIYIDKGNLRHDEGSVEREIVDVWRYEFKTKRRQRFAVADYREASSIGEAVSAPTGRKVFLGKQPEVRIKMPVPEWNIVWTQKRAGQTAWFQDSTAIVRIYGGEEKDRLLIEVLSPKGKTIFIGQRAKHIMHVTTDQQDNIYMMVSNADFEPDLINEIVRCRADLKERKLTCKPVLENYSIKSFDPLSNGEAIAFAEWRVEGCLRIAQTDNVEAPCITEASYHPGYYLKISSGERWLAFVAFHRKGDSTFANDLFIVKLKD